MRSQMETGYELSKTGREGCLCHRALESSTKNSTELWPLSDLVEGRIEEC